MALRLYLIVAASQPTVLLGGSSEWSQMDYTMHSPGRVPQGCGILAHGVYPTQRLILAPSHSFIRQGILPLKARLLLTTVYVGLFIFVASLSQAEPNYPHVMPPDPLPDDEDPP